MKKLFGLALVLLFASCQKDVTMYSYVPSDLEIPEIQGIKLQSYIVFDKVQINVKLPVSGEYRIKIFDFDNELVSQEVFNGSDGDNILNVYVNALPPSSYTVALYKNNTLIGKENFSNE
jgi:hypothetical protein